MKNLKKIIAVLLACLIIISGFSVSFVATAETKVNAAATGIDLKELFGEDNFFKQLMDFILKIIDWFKSIFSPLDPSDPDDQTSQANSLGCDSVSELLNNIAKDDVIAGLSKDLNDKTAFDSFIARLKNKSIYVPFYQGKEIVYRNQEGFSNIILHSSEAYAQPNLWFFPEINKVNNYISTMYLDILLNAEKIEQANNKGASWLLEQFFPASPNVNNAESFPNYKNIYEKELELGDRKVNALFYEFSDDQRITVKFVYDEILATVCIDADVAAEWLKDMTFTAVTVVK